MRKIGIYTFFRSNYGAMLQAYSLYKNVKEICPYDEVYMVDFKTKAHEGVNNVVKRRSPNFLFNFIWQLMALLRCRQLIRRKKSIEEFHNTAFQYTDCYSSVKELLENPPAMDLHLSGSDQVFNPKGKYHDVYFLNFPKKGSKKISYAPSFGVSSLTDEETNFVRKCANDFDALTCRENEGAKILSDLTGKDVPVVLDPVFLTSKSSWNNFAVNPPKDKPYIFIYALKDTAKLMKIALQIRSEKGINEIIILSPNDLRYYRHCRHIYYPGPKEFVGLVKNASTIVTDSFHGTAFSIIFEKEFYTYISKPLVSSRITTLLSGLGLSERIINNIDDIHFSAKLPDFQSQLAIKVLESKNILCNILSD